MIESFLRQHFVYGAHAEVSSFMALYQLHRSEEGSNERSKEDNTTYCFEIFLQDLEGGDVTG